jgi:hypothetical protein
VDLAFTNTIPGKTDSQTYSSRWQWKSQRQFDLVKSKMQISMDSGDGVTPDVWDSYVIGGWEYFHGISPPVLPVGSEAWFKTKLLENSSLFSNEAQISPLIELLKTATKISLVGLENVDGDDCYILQVTPSRESIADWVISQQQPEGLDLSVLSVNPPKYAKGYQESWIRVWIAKDSHLVKQTEFNVLFVIKQANIDFQGQMNFSDFNEPVSIEVPPEGLNAPYRQ